MYSKTQKIVALAYVAFVIMAMLSIHRGSQRHASTAFDLILGSPLPVMFGVFAIQNGWISSRYTEAIRRDEAPASFWFYVVCALLLGTGMLIWGVRAL